MIPFALTLLLFSFWLLVGLAVVMALRTRRNLLQNVLLAPTIGVAATTLPVFLLSRLGLPVGWISLPVTVLLLAGSALLLWRGRPDTWRRAVRAAGRAYAPFAAVLLLALLVTGRPMLEFGLSWVSYANDDMANYVLAAHRFVDNGFFTLPDPAVLMAGVDYTQFFWAFVFGGVRPGSELILAWTIGLTGLTGHQLFMPVIMALDLALISAAGALICQSRRARLAALVTCGLLGLSALHTLSVLYQLIGQVAGIGLLLAACTLLLRLPERRIQAITLPAVPVPAVAEPATVPSDRVPVGVAAATRPVASDPFAPDPVASDPFAPGPVAAVDPNAPPPIKFSPAASAAARHGVLLGIVGAALLIVYPEVVPFLGLSFLLALGLQAVRLRKAFPWKDALVILGCAGIAALVLINTYVIEASHFMATQIFGGLRGIAETQTSLFPYYLTPSGLANLWGFQTVMHLAPEPWLTIFISLGAVLLALTAFASVRLALRGQPAAIVTLVMLALAVQLFVKRADFGLYKLAMFIQPFMIGTLVVAWLSLMRNRPLAYRLGPLLLLGALGLPSQVAYVEASRGSGELIAEIPGASSSRINAEFQSLIQQTGKPAGLHLLLDTQSVVIAKFQALYTRGINAQFGSRNYFSLYRPVSPLPFESEQALQAAIAMGNALQQSQITASFPWFGERDVPQYVQEIFINTSPDQDLAEQPELIKREVQEISINTMGQVPGKDDACDYVVTTRAQHNLFNRWNRPELTEKTGRNFSMSPCQDVRNHLVFIDSELGRHYYSTYRSTELITLYQLEPDIIMDGETFAGVGRWMLFRVLRPSEGARLTLSLTSTLKGDGENLLPPAVVVGADRQPLPLMGRGSARVFSGPISPLTIADRALVGLDMGADGELFPDRRTGLMRLFGTDILLDRRRLIGFARDVSVVTREEVERLAPPALVQEFPKDLGNPQIEYSGMYEDGWISEDAFLGLAQAAAASSVVVQGMVPAIRDNTAFTTELRVLVDGQEIARQKLGVGDFEIRAPAPGGPGRKRIELHFSDIQQLPGTDRRPVAAQMKRIGFKTDAEIEQEEVAKIPAAIATFPDDLRNPLVQPVGFSEDGWAADRAQFWLAKPAAASSVAVRGTVPLIGDPSFGTDVRVLVDGQEVAQQHLTVGEFEVKAPVPPGSGRRRVELRFSQTQQLPQPDTRRAGALLRFVGFE